MTKDQIIERFQYHTPDDDKVGRIEQIRTKATELAMLVHDLVPASLERRQAIDYLQMMQMLANRGIVLYELGDVAAERPDVGGVSVEEVAEVLRAAPELVTDLVPMATLEETAGEPSGEPSSDATE